MDSSLIQHELINYIAHHSKLLNHILKKNNQNCLLLSWYRKYVFDTRTATSESNHLNLIIIIIIIIKKKKDGLIGLLQLKDLLNIR